MEEQLRELIDVLKELAPEVWGIYMKQQVITGYEMLGFSLLLLLVSIFCGIKAHNEDETIFWVISILVLAMSVLIGMGGAEHLINPEYFAIQSLLGR
jgi:ABC-type multidrug transport system permease subunit